MTSRQIVTFGVAGLIGQLAFWHLVRTPPVEGPLAGEPFPALEALGLEENIPEILGEKAGECLFVTVMATSCPFSSRMRHTWGNEYRIWRAGTTGEIRVVWLFAEPAGRVKAWTEGRIYDGVTVMTIRDRPGERTSALRHLGVVGTPTSYLVGKTGEVLVGIGGPQLPPSELVAERCD